MAKMNPAAVEAVAEVAVVAAEAVAAVVHHRLYWKGKMQGKLVKCIMWELLMMAQNLTLPMIVGSHWSSSVVQV